jgi:hypothetical protein
MEIIVSIGSWIVKIISLLADFSTIIASGIAIYLFFFKGKYILTVFNVLVNYTTQLTLAELKEKLDVLNDLKVTREEDREEIINVMHDITGQLRGNPKLTPHFSELMRKIEKITMTKGKLTEHWKRSIVSEIREKIRHIGIMSIEEISGEKK